ncbi:MAG: heavy-metal-associated domain-containing protein [Bacteroidetes bacterium]|jgi:copper chaperone CopZ|nr:heavy-metal-associated domain-containing protein [Bacteroidota bacterium]MBT6686862.1 heavy-metal-associated domain-containing protein [Bacteroidota bacterium]MBT7142587.1 heavy-metal-associated domain-containing protein [Bacteroidota bacterium]MBT7491856.1 heavy-metal-associated domain-containing protein [Bacteroidota bacterium]
MKTIKIKIENLKCNGCASTITKALVKFEEVANVDIDIENSIVKISFEGVDKNIDKYKKKLSVLGYPETGNNNTFSVAKSFVSCAIGRVSK